MQREEGSVVSYAVLFVVLIAIALFVVPLFMMWIYNAIVDDFLPGMVASGQVSNHAGYWHFFALTILLWIGRVWMIGSIARNKD